MVSAVLLGTPRGAAARGEGELDEVEARINYVYATQFGFGGYKVGGLNADVYSLPIGFTVDDVLDSWDLQVGLPITYGSFRFSDGLNVLETDETVFIRAETNTIAFEPRLQLDIPIPWLPGLRVSPLGAFGFGTTFSSSGSAQAENERIRLETDETQFYTYQIGVSSLYTRRWNDFTFLLGNAFIYAGDASFDDGPDDLDDNVEGYGTFRTGIEGRYPLGFTIADFAPDAGVFFVYNLFTPSLEFTRVARAALEIDQIFEVGGTIGAARPYEVEWLPDMVNDALNDFRIGVGYQSGKDLDGVRLTFGVPF
jgi:hypothetical protein